MREHQVKEALLSGQSVVKRGWTIQITANDEVEIWPPRGRGFSATVAHLDQAVRDFCKKAEMPEPGVRKHKDPVSLPKNVLGPDSSTDEFKCPKTNSDSKFKMSPKELGTDSSKGEGFANPSVTYRPEPRGKLPKTDLGKDTSGNSPKWAGRKRALYEDMDLLRDVDIDGYRLQLFDKNLPTGKYGHTTVSYKFISPEGKVIFEGDDYGVPRGQAVDSDETVRGLLGFLTIRPGDTDDEYFDNYTEDQLSFANDNGENLSGWGMDPNYYDSEDDAEYYKLKDWEDRKASKRIADTFATDADPSSIYRELKKVRPSRELLAGIADPEKWAANQVLGEFEKNIPMRGKGQPGKGKATYSEGQDSGQIAECKAKKALNEPRTTAPVFKGFLVDVTEYIKDMPAGVKKVYDGYIFDETEATYVASMTPSIYCYYVGSICDYDMELGEEEKEVIYDFEIDLQQYGENDYFSLSAGKNAVLVNEYTEVPEDEEAYDSMVQETIESFQANGGLDELLMAKGRKASRKAECKAKKASEEYWAHAPVLKAILVDETKFMNGAPAAVKGAYSGYMVDVADTSATPLWGRFIDSVADFDYEISDEEREEVDYWLSEFSAQGEDTDFSSDAMDDAEWVGDEFEVPETEEEYVNMVESAIDSFRGNGGVEQMFMDKGRKASRKRAWGGEAGFGEKDRVVLDAFIDQTAASSKNLSTDGSRLEGSWMGGGIQAFWEDDKIYINDNGGKTDELIGKMLKKMTPANLWGGYATNYWGGDDKTGRKVAGPKLRERWHDDGGYQRDIEAESAEELHALVRGFGGEEVDWEPFQKPAEPINPVAKRRKGYKGVSDVALGYMEAALWSSTDESDDSGGEPMDRNYGIMDIEPDSLAKMAEDADTFAANHAEELAQYSELREGSHEGRSMDELIGHDLWLSANGHGTGFWDQGAEEVGDALHDAAQKEIGESYLYVGDEGQVYCDGGGKSRRGSKGEDKKSVDEKAKDYYSKYMGDYGKKMTEKDVTDGPEKQKRQRGPKKGQATPPAAPPAAPQEGPTAPTKPPLDPNAPAPGGAQKAPTMKPGMGDAGLTALGWTATDIQSMDDEQKQKILQVKLNKPGTQPPKPTKAPAAPGAPTAPTPPAPGAPPAAPDAPEMPMAGPKARKRGQAAPAMPGQAPQAAPKAGPTAPPQPEGQPAQPPAGASKPLPEFAEEPAGGQNDAETQAFTILSEVQRLPVEAASPQEVVTLKTQALAQKLLSEAGMSIKEAEKLFGVGQKGLSSLFRSW